MDEERLVNILEEVLESVADDTNELIVASAALFISVVALFAAVLQVAQQYYASAIGYANCDAKVVGKWSQFKRRVFRPHEFRFEVQYEVPVIFLCAPTNIKGPIPNQDIWYLGVKCPWPELEDGAGRPGEAEEKVHTAHNELATWVGLLSVIQGMERKSRYWQSQRLVHFPPPHSGEPVDAAELAGRAKKKVEDKHTLVVAVQRRVRSWDTMPPGVTKPYATTTWCHMIELAAVLGIYWVEFDRSRDRYRAEGNGYMLTGEKVADLGIMFTFRRYGSSNFEENRVIPVEGVKDLSFGAVPTIYRAANAIDSRRLGFDDDRQDLSMLSLASRAEIAETLSIIGCNTNTVNYFAKDSALKCRVSHLFPLPFEIIGMLSRTLRIEDSAFRLLPNPTIFQWKVSNATLWEILKGYLAQVEEKGVLLKGHSPVMETIRRHGGKIQSQIEKLKEMEEQEQEEIARARENVVLSNVLHRALDDTDEILTAKPKGAMPPNPCGPETEQERKQQRAQKERERLRRQKVQDVLRSHIQEVLSALNEKPFDKEPDHTQAPLPTFPGGGLSSSPFEAIDSAAPEDRPGKLMEIYFDVVRQRVVGSATQATNRRASMAGPEPSPPALGIWRRATGQSMVAPDAVSVANEDPDASEERDKLHVLPAERSVMASDSVSNESLDESEVDEPWHLSTADVSHEDIWCTLVFRMICWLMLHHFHPKDVQITKSELRGSRLAVYIA